MIFRRHIERYAAEGVNIIRLGGETFEPIQPPAFWCFNQVVKGKIHIGDGDFGATLLYYFIKIERARVCAWNWPTWKPAFRFSIMIGAAFGFWAYGRGFQAGDHVCREISERVNIFIEKCNSVRTMYLYPVIAFIKEKVFIFN